MVDPSKCVQNFNFLCLKVPEIIINGIVLPAGSVHLQAREWQFDPDSASQRQFPLCRLRRLLDTLSVKLQTLNVMQGLATISTNLQMTNCPVSGRGQGHVALSRISHP